MEREKKPSPPQKPAPSGGKVAELERRQQGSKQRPAKGENWSVWEDMGKI
jgi:hypothetical protein